ncbi:hypothetical protein ACVWZ3_009514 [Bradyrhizobium sp. i1.3.6]
MTQLDHQLHSIGPEVAGSRIFKFIGFLYGIAAYLVFFVTILYAIGFVMGLVVPKTIDTGTDTPTAEAVIINLLLMTLFAVQHSVMARKQFKASGGRSSSPSRSSARPTCCSRACHCCSCSGSGVQCLRSYGMSETRISP